MLRGSAFDLAGEMMQEASFRMKGHLSLQYFDEVAKHLVCGAAIFWNPAHQKGRFQVWFWNLHRWTKFQLMLLIGSAKLMCFLRLSHLNLML